MDFGSLLSTAQKNGHNGKKEVRYYSTKFEPPKKEHRNKTLSVNIKNFLAKKEAEEKRKAEEERKKRDELLVLRSKDKKATRRVNVMLKRTKSANQSAIQDAVDEDNTAVTLVGPSQPDEDDYGYVSQEAAAYYNKMMEKYSKMPDEPKFSLTKKKASSNLNSTKERIRAALEREKEEAMMPHRRKRKHKEDEVAEKEDSIIDDAPEVYKSAKPKPKPAPPPMNFAELLKMAEKKQFEPIVIEPKNVKDDERPLTKRQKKEMEREREWRERKERGVSNPFEKNRIPKINSKPSGSESNRIPKLNGQSEIRKEEPNKIPKINNSNSKINNNNSVTKPGLVSSTSKPLKPINDSNRMPKPDFTKRPNTSSSSKPPVTASKAPNKNVPPLKRPLKQDDINKGEQLRRALQNNPQSKPNVSRDLKTNKQLPPSDLKSKQLSPSDLKPKQFPPKDLKPKQFPPADLRPKQFPPGDVRRRELPPGGIRMKQPLIDTKKRRILDDDEEYDSEMDDFIDDGPEEGEDYSKYISEIFGYDKSRYRNVDDDIDNMESTFAQQMREEVISTKIGIMEDLEDMKKEDEEKRRKALMKKRQKI